MTLRLAVADDQALVRAGLCGILLAAPDLTVVGEAATGEQAVALVRAEKPDVVLMDIRMPELDGIEATLRITATEETRVLILTTFDLDEYVYSALRGGASGFLLKDTPPRQLIDAVRTVAHGDALLARPSPGGSSRISPPGHPPPHTPRDSASSPTASARSSPSSPTALPTTRSPATCISAPAPPKPTSGTCSPS